MTELDSDQAATLRGNLAATLHEQGAVSCPAWLAAARTVPRHLFVPTFFRRVDSGGQTMWHPLSSAQDPGEWLTLAYSDQTLVTQIDNTICAAEATGPVPAGEPTSSSTLPSVVLRMLEDLNVTDTTTVVEVGTGTGYSTALMCQRLGDDRVISIEVDADVAARAATALHKAGYHPHRVIGDGLTSHLTTQSDRLIATCSVQAIPAAWVAQIKAGGQILAPIGGWLHACALARLDVAADGSASGHFLPGEISFMLARPHAPPHLTPPSGQRSPTPPARRPPDPSWRGGACRMDTGPVGSVRCPVCPLAGTTPRRRPVGRLPRGHRQRLGGSGDAPDRRHLHRAADRASPALGCRRSIPDSMGSSRQPAHRPLHPGGT